MDGSNNQLGATGGAVATDNPQNIGNQNLTPTQNNLQQQGEAVLNSQNLRLTDENGQTLNLQTTNTTSASVRPPAASHHSPILIGASALIIVGVFVATWFITRKSTQVSY